MRNARPPALLAALAGAAIAFVALPLLALVARVPWSRFVEHLLSEEARDALTVSLVTSLLASAVALALGVPLALALARTPFRGVRVVRPLVTLPMVMPPVVAGVALLAAFGRRGVVGQPLQEALGLSIPFTPVAVVLAQAFVSLPFVVVTVEAGVRSVDSRMEEAARTLGAKSASVLRRVTLPLARTSIAAGAVLAWARSLGEFGATLTFAGNLPGETQTLPLAVYLSLERNDGAALALSVLLVAVCFVVLLVLRDRWLRPT